MKNSKSKELFISFAIGSKIVLYKYEYPEIILPSRLKLIFKRIFVHIPDNHKNKN